MIRPVRSRGSASAPVSEHMALLRPAATSSQQPSSTPAAASRGPAAAPTAHGQADPALACRRLVPRCAPVCRRLGPCCGFGYKRLFRLPVPSSLPGTGSSGPYLQRPVGPLAHPTFACSAHPASVGGQEQASWALLGTRISVVAARSRRNGRVCCPLESRPRRWAYLQALLERVNLLPLALLR